jgi:hypothetical protein
MLYTSSLFGNWHARHATELLSSADAKFHEKLVCAMPMCFCYANMFALCKIVRAMQMFLRDANVLA